MPEMDALSLSITASTKQAEDKIDSLISSLKKLDTAFRSLTGSTTYATNLETAVHAITRVNNAISNIDATHMASVAKAMKDLGKSGNMLSTFGTASQIGKELDTATAKSQKLANSLASSFNIKDKEAISGITESIKTMINTMGRGRAFYEAEAQLRSLLEGFGQFKNKLYDAENAYEKVRQIIRENPLYIPENYSAEKDWLSNKATIGIMNTTSDKNAGVSAGYLASKLEGLISGLQGLSNEADIINTIADYLRNNATPAMIGYEEASNQGIEANHMLKQSIDDLEQSLGIVLPTLEQIKQAEQSVDYSNMTDIDDMWRAETEALQQMRDQIQPTIAEIDRLAQTTQKVQDVQPFEKLVTGLESLQGVTLGDFSSITVLAEGVNRLGYQSAVTAAQILPQIAEGLHAFDGFVLPNIEGLDSFAQGVRSLGSKAVQNAAYALPFVADGLKQISSLQFPDMSNLTEFARALSVFGRQTSERAVTNIPQLAKAFNQLFQALSKAPTISRNTIDAANAMANLASRTGSVSTALNRATPSLNLWSKSASNSAKHTFSLAAAIGKVYATYWMLFRAFGLIRKSINIASDLTEVRNVVTHAFDDMAYKANAFAEAAGESFGMSKLQALDAASRYQAMGKTMGVTNDMVIKANKRLRDSLTDTLSIEYVRKAYGDLGDTAADMSINLSKLAGDLASLYNTDIEIAAEKLSSIFTGTTKPLREFGFDLTQATLQEWALTNGIDANVKSMTQAEKAVLRYQYVMANAGFVLGDFVRTADSWHNTIVRLKMAFQNLGATIGQGFINLLKPAIQKITAFVNTLTGLIQKAINAIGKLLGWQMEIDPVAPMDESLGGAMDDAEGISGAMEDTEDAAGGTAKNMKKGADAAKKMKDYLLGIDELNVFRPDEDTSADKGTGSGGKGSGGGAKGGANGGASGGDVRFEKYKSAIDSWYELGKKIADTIGDALWNIDWKAIQTKAEKAARALAEFLNGIFASSKLWTGLGHTIAEGLNTALAFLERFFDLFNWGSAGRRIGEMINQAVADFKWEKLGRTIAKGINGAFEFLWNLGITFDAKKLGEGIASSINEFFAKLDAKWIARGLNIWVDKIKELLITTISTIKWGEVFDKLKELLSELDIDTLTVIFGLVAWKLAGKALTNAVIQELLITSLFGTAKNMILAIPKLFINFGSFVLSGITATSLAATIGQQLMGLKAAIPQIFRLYLVEPITAFVTGTAIPAITSALGSIGGAIGLTGSAAVLGGAGIVAAAVISAIAIIFNWDKIKKMKLGDTLAKIIKDTFFELPKKLGNLGKNIGDALGEAVQKGLEFMFIKIPSFIASIDIMGAFHGLGEKIGSVVGNLIKLAITGIIGLLSVDGGILNGITQFVANLVVSFAKAVADTDWSTIGTNILKGIVFVFTIPGRILAIIGEAIAGLFTGIYDGICQAFGIKSPAEKMKPLGGYILLGVVEGFKGKLGDFIKALNDWYNNSVKPWFSLDKWKALGQNIVTGIITKWNEFKTQWVVSITNWWNSNVRPWFTLDKWKTEADHIREAIKSKWDATVGQWITDIASWWNQHIVPWFKLDKWKAEADHIRDAIITKFNETVSEWITKISNWWNQHVVPWFKLDTWKSLANNIKTAILGAIDDTIKDWGGKIQKLIDSFADVFKESKFKEIGKKAIDAVVDGFKSLDIVNALSSWATGVKDWLKNLFTIKPTVETNQTQQTTSTTPSKKTSKKASGGVFDSGRWHNIHAYGTGGAPLEGELFWAREKGPELVGQIGGNTAVMNNDQIVASVAAGVQQAVTEALAPYLSDISQNTRVTANKDFTVQIGDRQIAEANNRGQRAIGAVLFS